MIWKTLCSERNFESPADVWKFLRGLHNIFRKIKFFSKLWAFFFWARKNWFLARIIAWRESEIEPVQFNAKATLIRSRVTPLFFQIFRCESAFFN